MLRGGLSVPELGGAAPQVLAGLAQYDPDILVRFPSATAGRDGDSSDRPFVQAVFAVAESRPVLLVLDDAGRADPEVIDDIGAIVQRAGEARVCALLSASAGPGAPALDALGQQAGRGVNGSIVKTGLFDTDDVVELVRWAFPDYNEEG
jgi:hypothetical protein